MHVTEHTLRALPKAELHVHLDGSLRPATMVELASEQGRALPTNDPEALARMLRAREGEPLESYLSHFAVTLSLLQEADALERAAFELALDHVEEGVRYLEVRYSPLLHTERGLTLPETVDAPLRGLRRAEAETGLRSALILCGIRHMDPQTSKELAELTVAYKDRGVVAFDLAGAEYNYPAKKHREAFFTVINRNMGTTIHAGEAHGPESIHQALHYCRANRIGHGTRLYEDPELERYVRDFRVPIEICLTSNVQTGAVPGIEAHPLRRYFDLGIVVTLCTDNRLISGTTLTGEYLLAHRELGFTGDDLCAVARMGFESAFLPWDEKQRVLRAFDEDVGRAIS